MDTSREPVSVLIRVRRFPPNRTVTAIPLHVSILLLEFITRLSCSPVWSDMLTLAKPLPKKAESQACMRTTPRACTTRTRSRHPCASPHGMAPSHVRKPRACTTRTRNRHCSDRSPILPCVRRSRKSFAVQSRPIRAHSAAKPSRSANSAPRKFWSYAPPLTLRAAQRETQTVLYSQCTPR